MLTIADVKNAQPGSRNYKLADSKGLFLLVTTTGAKSWRFKYRFGAKERLMTLGLYPDLGLAAARVAHEDARRLLREGKDPVLEDQRRKQAQIDASQATFKKLGNEWLEEQDPLWSRANAVRVRHRLERDLFPMFGHRPIGEIDGAMILRALRKIEARGSIETAKRVRGYIMAIFRRAKGERLVSAATMMEIDEIKDALKPAPRGGRHPSLTTLPELLDLQRCVDRSTANVLTKLASRLLALTLVRIGVLRTARWSEFYGIDWENPDVVPEKAIWKISAERMKLIVEDKLNPAFGHDVPLPMQAVEVLHVVRMLTGTCEYLFPQESSWREPMSDGAVSGLYKRMAGGRFKKRMVPHGWRSAFSTIMNERAAELERDGDRMLIDMILSHVPPGVSASEWAYNRARYLRPRAGLHQVWADLITDGLPPAQMLINQTRRSDTEAAGGSQAREPLPRSPIAGTEVAQDRHRASVPRSERLWAVNDR
ncbi:tyrosine-type recombinase/integrase [Sphingomonas tabacisoli]|uniref:Tyrosine-type recombinase/integrase n=1 Tax=Sphingomonas tabacisoli TaxID=2249466 RepID=A0ABW4I3G4_9SPHN